MDAFVTGIAECYLVVRCISASLPTLQVVHMKLDLLPVGTAALTGVTISPEDILSHIVVPQHLALLIVFAFRYRSVLLDGFDQLQVELCSFYNHFGDRKDLTHTLDRGNVFLDLHLYRRCQPAFVLTSDAVIEARLAIPRLAVSTGPAELPATGEKVYYIVTGCNFRGEELFLLRGCGETDCFASGINAKNDILGIASAAIQ